MAEEIEKKTLKRKAPVHMSEPLGRQKSIRGDSSTSWEKLIVGLLIAIVFIYGFNTYQLVQIKSMDFSSIGLSEASLSTSTNIAAGLDVIPKGVPKTYGSELGVSFSDVTPSNPQLADATIKKMSAFDQQITLTGDDLQRYIATVSQISCEYCCGAQSIIFNDGKPACGCAHSYAMRGIAKYLIQNHGEEYTNDQILEELGKWKTLFFPGQISAKAEVLKAQGVELNYINLASNKYRGAEKGAQSGGQMVGGC